VLQNNWELLPTRGWLSKLHKLLDACKVKVISSFQPSASYASYRCRQVAYKTGSPPACLLQLPARKAFAMHRSRTLARELQFLLRRVL
jgi:hypothetical protein